MKPFHYSPSKVSQNMIPNTGKVSDFLGKETLRLRLEQRQVMSQAGETRRRPESAPTVTKKRSGLPRGMSPHMRE